MTDASVASSSGFWPSSSSLASPLSAACQNVKLFLRMPYHRTPTSPVPLKCVNNRCHRTLGPVCEKERGQTQLLGRTPIDVETFPPRTRQGSGRGRPRDAKGSEGRSGPVSKVLEQCGGVVCSWRRHLSDKLDIWDLPRARCHCTVSGKTAAGFQSLSKLTSSQGRAPDVTNARRLSCPGPGRRGGVLGPEPL